MARGEQRSLRFGRFESRRLLAALLLSLLVHLIGWGGYELGKKLDWLKYLQALSWLEHVKKTTSPPPKPADTEPTVFVEVTQADPEPPKNTVYYSDKNSHAANPDADKNSNKPKLDGKQKDVPKTENVPKPSQPKPTPPQTPPPVHPAQDTEQSSPQNMGDTQLTKVEKTGQPTENPQPQQLSRPRTLSEALARQHIRGQEMQQDGGVSRNRLVASFDAKATSFGAYDGAIIAAVSQYWYDELDRHQYAQDRSGQEGVP